MRAAAGEQTYLIETQTSSVLEEPAGGRAVQRSSLPLKWSCSKVSFLKGGTVNFGVFNQLL